MVGCDPWNAAWHHRETDASTSSSSRAGSNAEARRHWSGTRSGQATKPTSSVSIELTAVTLSSTPSKIELRGKEDARPAGEQHVRPRPSFALPLERRPTDAGSGRQENRRGHRGARVEGHSMADQTLTRASDELIVRVVDRTRSADPGRGLGQEGRTRQASGTRGYALPVSSSASDRLHRIRVTGPIGDPRSIRGAERMRRKSGSERRPRRVTQAGAALQDAYPLCQPPRGQNSPLLPRGERRVGAKCRGLGLRH